MYLPTGFIASRRKTFRGKECLTWAEVRELRQFGMRFGSHTVNHPQLYALQWGQIDAETAQSKERLECELQEDVRSFAYPYAFPQEDGAFSARFANLLRRQGYETCVTTVVGRVDAQTDPFRIVPLPANNCDDRLLFQAKLDGAYDWVAAVQRLARNMRQRRRTTRTIMPASLVL